MSDIDNDTPISHFCRNLTTFKAPRADLRDGVTVDVFDGTTAEQLAADYFEFGAWHAFTIWPQLNGFQGYSHIKFTLSPQSKIAND